MAGRTSKQALTTGDVVRQTLTGRRLDVGTLVFEGLLLLALLITIGLLVVLLAVCSAFATRAFRSYQRSV